MTQIDRTTTSGKACVAFDQQGSILAVTVAPFVKLYNMRQLSVGPFLEVSLEHSHLLQFKNSRPNSSVLPLFTSCVFDPSGKYLLIATNLGYLMLVNSFNGHVEFVLTGFAYDEKRNVPVSFSPTGSQIFCGADDGTIFCWSCTTGALLQTWPRAHPSYIKALAFNPSFANFISVSNSLSSSASEMSFWVPKL